MTMKQCYATIEGGMMKLPDEVLEILPQGTRLYMRTDPEKGTVLIYAEDPTDRSKWPNQDYMAEMRDLMADENWEEYSKPVPEELMRRPRKKEGE